LAKYKENIHRVGHDKSRKAVNFAKENDVVDKITLTLSNAVKDADIILLALPLQEIQPVLEHIALDLKEGALVIDTAPLKVPVLGWIEETLPERANYVGFTPVIKAAYLEEWKYGPEVAHADLFENSLIGLVSGRKTTEKSINMAINFAQLLGATPYFSDAAEMDGLMSTTHLLPQLLAASLLKISLDSPGWREARKFAGKIYSQLTNSFGQDDLPGELASAVINNQENTIRLINDLIRSLIDIRDLTETSDQEKLDEIFTKLQQGRDLWLADRRENRWIETPKIEVSRPGILSQLLGFRGPKTTPEDK
ncbi:MAG: prephenate dehydrogenase/arogenate dehydrogenase family protein, partial [Anaerolineales bacterium]|nr:prephenate dehydrogenase/arogenate dehydrogenase family protein [Anaerolineales bacterium]